MPGSSFGQAFRVTTAGESHGPAEIAIVDGCPPGLELCERDLALDLERRRPGQSDLTSARDEADQPEILSGVYDGRTTGTPIAVMIPNRDARSADYAAVEHAYRPGHADHSYDAKYGARDPRGGGRASARETVTRVAAGAIARKLVARAFGGRIVGYVVQVADIAAHASPPEAITRADVDTLPSGEPNLVRCPDYDAAARMIDRIEAARADGDSVGGIAQVCATGVPAGLGEPVFHKLKADLASALMGLPAVMGVEYGVGFGCAALRGSELNDAFTMHGGAVRTATNRHGGVLGGISSGMPIVLRAAVKPASSIAKAQETVTGDGAPTTIEIPGRHDPCVLPRFVPVAEAMVALVLADHWLRWVGQRRGLQ